MPAEYTSLEKIRLEKLETLKKRGVEPYPTRAQRTHTSRQAVAAFEEAEEKGSAQPVQAIVAGRIRSMRVMGKITFAHIEDGEGRLQLFLRADEIGRDALEIFNRDLDIGDFVQARGGNVPHQSGRSHVESSGILLVGKVNYTLAGCKRRSD